MTRRHVALPVLASPRRPTDDPRFVVIRDRELALRAEVDQLSLAALRREDILSGNAKTSVSFDFPIGHTCTPTELCASVCYASRPGTPAAWDKSLAKRLRNLRYVTLEAPSLVAARMYQEFLRWQRYYMQRGAALGFLRINGTGDLFPESVAALNAFTAAFPDVALWVVSRKAYLAEQLEPRPSLYLQLSVDATTPRADYDRFVALVRRGRAYLSYLRTDAAQHARAAAIVFNEKRTTGLEYSGITDCPADAGMLALGNIRGKGGTACASCRKCFSPKTLERQAALLQLHDLVLPPGARARREAAP